MLSQISTYSTKNIVPTPSCTAQQSELAVINQLLLDVFQPLNSLRITVTYIASILTIQLCNYSKTGATDEVYKSVSMELYLQTMAILQTMHKTRRKPVRRLSG